MALLGLTLFKITRPEWQPGQPGGWEYALQPALGMLLLSFLALATKKRS